MAFGSNGAILRVDLTAGTTAVETFDEAFFRRYPGGKALAAYHLLREMPAGADPLGPDNVLVLAAGLLAGAPLSTATRFNAIARSPLTGGFGESEAGGYWGPELKMAGFDAIILTGRSPEPVWLWVKDGTAEIRDGRALWGQDPATVQAAIKEAVGEKAARVLQIGRAGENLVPYAMIMNELRHYNGRTGMGAVMGSKNVRAIAVKGSRRYVELAHDPQALGEIGKRLVEDRHRAPAELGPAHEGDARPHRRVERGRDPADPQLPAGIVRAGRGDRLRRVRGHPERHPFLLRVRGPVQARDGVRGPLPRHRHLRRPGVRGDRRVRLELRDLRHPARRARQRAVQRAGARRHLHRGNGRLRHGVRGARPARAGRPRRPGPALRQRRGAARGDPADRRPTRRGRAARAGLAADRRAGRWRLRGLRHAGQGPRSWRCTSRAARWASRSAMRRTRRARTTSSPSTTRSS